MAITRKLAELETRCAQLGLHPAAGRGGKPGKQECIRALSDYFIAQYKEQGLLHPCQEWVHNNVYSPKLAISPTSCKPENVEELWNSPDVECSLKADGERILLCYDPESGFGIYSRNRSVTEGNPEQCPYFFGDYTNQFKAFSGKYKGLFKKSFILDCELTVDSKQLIARMGAETQLAAVVALSALNREESWAIQDQYPDALNWNVFDCIMLDNKSTMQLPYEKRQLLVDKLLARIAEVAETVDE